MQLGGYYERQMRVLSEDKHKIMEAFLLINIRYSHSEIDISAKWSNLK